MRSYYAPHITPTLWTGFEAMCGGFLAMCPDYISNLITPLDNMITKDPAGFLSRSTADGVSYLQLTWNVVEKAFETRSESDSASAARVWSSVLLSCSGAAADAYADAIVERCAVARGVVKTAEGRVRRARRRLLARDMCDPPPLRSARAPQNGLGFAIAACLFYNPVNALRALARLGGEAPLGLLELAVAAGGASLRESRMSDSERKLLALGLLRLLNLGDGELAPIAGLLPSVIAAVVNDMMAIYKKSMLAAADPHNTGDGDMEGEDDDGSEADSYGQKPPGAGGRAGGGSGGAVRGERSWRRACARRRGR